ncbi:28S ribosomal protein S15, mitochondrial [Calliopsis andreniformis]|uniref:28S ribosomal protein S15, mitochondrial n=1 Tax=Calliopsis andreniformis TaxID=337506 RepID=UPI003FCDE474
MNLATNCLRLVSTKINIYQFGGYVSRNASSVEDHKIKWVRPARIPEIDPKQSGDVEIRVDVNPAEIKVGYRDSKEMEDANEIVKKMFSLKFQPLKSIKRAKREQIINLVRRHTYDYGSVEAQIAIMTSQIQYYQKYMQEHPTNSTVKVCLKELIDKRKKFLKLLRNWDYRRFEWILERLNLIYKPVPRKLGMVTRKDSLRLLTQQYCDKVIQDKLDAYKMELMAQQKEFYRNKAKQLQFIFKEEKALGLEPSVTEEEIEAAQRKAKELENN